MSRGTIIVLSAILIILIASLLVLNHARYEKVEGISLEITLPETVYEKFTDHSEAWAKVFENVSTIPEYWNVTIPPNLADKSIHEIAAIFGGNVYFNDFEYAYCYISVPKRNCQALNQTLTGIGFTIEEVSYLTPNQ
ncbi:hypothetical protein HXY33_04815 [Candidatus Bathyarchaeota archaeon]|nr:hypothetical protein [Candidatus Bathyarchaeota archaeon]